MMDDEEWYREIITYMNEVEPIIVLATLCLILASYSTVVELGADGPFWIATLFFITCIFSGWSGKYKIFKWSFILGLAWATIGVFELFV